MTYSKEAKILSHPGKLGDHPVGGAVGAAVGAVAGSAAVGAVTGATLGTIVGFPGMAAGVAIGGVVGALAGKAIAQQINPNEEEVYWLNQHKHQAYFDSTTAYDSYAPAYRFGIEAYSTYVGRKFDEVEAQLGKQWDDARGTSRLTWDTARLATRDAYERLYNKNA